VFDGLFSQSYATVLGLVAAGEGLAIVPSLAAAGERVAFAGLGALAPTRDIDLLALPGAEAPHVAEARRLLHASASAVSA
jgi:hypothetical protein